MTQGLTYKQQLLHPNWQRRRLEILQRDDFCCARCYDKETTLHVHHRHYINGRMAWEYADHELVTLCEPCHEEMHALSDAWRTLLAKLQPTGPNSIDEAYALVAGWSSVWLVEEQPPLAQDHPDSYIAGRVADLIEQAGGAALARLEDVIRDLTPGQMRVAVDRFSDSLKANPPEEPPGIGGDFDSPF